MIKSNLPETIVKNGLTYVRNYAYFYSKQLAVDLESVPKQIEQAKEHGLKYLTVEVLHRNLRGREDLHSKPYKPHKYVFVAETPKEKTVKSLPEHIEKYVSKNTMFNMVGCINLALLRSCTNTTLSNEELKKRIIKRFASEMVDKKIEFIEKGKIN
jgi:aconitase A